EAPLWIGLGVVLGVAVTSLTLFDPTRVGLHDFYRRRIAASFLQAARVFRADTSTEESDDDDVTLGDLETDAPARPIHLVCCTANNLSGDALPNLYRGGRSV